MICRNGVVERRKNLQAFLKTRLCRYYPSGRCTLGESCKFAHDDEEMRVVPDFRKTRLCELFLKGMCPLSENECSFAHSREELKIITDVYKTDLCRHWCMTGSCRSGTQCRFAHGTHELRRRTDSGVTLPATSIHGGTTSPSDLSYSSPITTTQHQTIWSLKENDGGAVISAYNSNQFEPSSSPACSSNQSPSMSPNSRSLSRLVSSLLMSSSDNTSDDDMTQQIERNLLNEGNHNFIPPSIFLPEVEESYYTENINACSVNPHILGSSSPSNNCKGNNRVVGILQGVENNQLLLSPTFIAHIFRLQEELQQA